MATPPRTGPPCSISSSSGRAGSKTGVGLVLDLGASHAVDQVDLTTVGSPTSVSVYVSATAPATLAGSPPTAPPTSPPPTPPSLSTSPRPGATSSSGSPSSRPCREASAGDRRSGGQGWLTSRRTPSSWPHTSPATPTPSGGCSPTSRPALGRRPAHDGHPHDAADGLQDGLARRTAGPRLPGRRGRHHLAAPGGGQRLPGPAPGGEGTPYRGPARRPRRAGRPGSAHTASGERDDPELAAIADERRRALLSALATLPAEQRAALVLVDMEGTPSPRSPRCSSVRRGREVALLARRGLAPRCATAAEPRPRARSRGTLRRCRPSHRTSPPTHPTPPRRRCPVTGRPDELGGGTPPPGRGAAHRADARRRRARMDDVLAGPEPGREPEREPEREGAASAVPSAMVTPLVARRRPGSRVAWSPRRRSWSAAVLAAPHLSSSSSSSATESGSGVAGRAVPPAATESPNRRGTPARAQGRARAWRRTPSRRG